MLGSKTLELFIISVTKHCNHGFRQKKNQQQQQSYKVTK